MLMVKQMRDKKEITEEQYITIQERNEKLSNIIKKDIVVDEIR